MDLTHLYDSFGRIDPLKYYIVLDQDLRGFVERSSLQRDGSVCARLCNVSDTTLPKLARSEAVLCCATYGTPLYGPNGRLRDVSLSTLQGPSRTGDIRGNVDAKKRVTTHVHGREAKREREAGLILSCT